MSSWGDKKSDARTPMGPYLVTLDEIGNPYDLLIYTRQSGLLRDRSHTGAMALGIERTIHWLSAFHTLYPGDVIHMGTMGYDGSPYLHEFAVQGGDYLESEIEGLGILRNPIVIDTPQYDWREANDPARKIHPSPAVRRLLKTHQTTTTIDDWSIESVRHVWLNFGNYQDADQQEHMQKRPYPRFLCAPNTIIAMDNAPVEIPASAGDIWLGCELAFVVGKLAHEVDIDEANQYILGYTPMLSVYDTSFEDQTIEPASTQERYAPQVYGRWRDGFNIIAQPQASTIAESAICRVSLDGDGVVDCNIDEYVHSATGILAYISRYVTLFPDDVITLGRLSKRLPVPIGTQAIGTAEIGGVGQFAVQINDLRVSS